MVDDRRPIIAYQEIVEKLYDPMADLEAHKFTHRKPMNDLPFTGKGAVGDENVMISTECKSKGVEFLIVDIGVDRQVNSDVEQRRKDIQRFAKEIVPNIKTQLGCTM